MAEESGLSAWDIVDKMMHNDAFSDWLGIKIVTIEPGFAKINMTVEEVHTNGFKIAHGGIAYSLADSALAFASNSRGRIAVSVSTHINHLEKINIGDKLQAVSEEIHLGEKNATYRIIITNQDEVKVASFEGTVYRTSKIWE
jgi:acyl-CoA thioesterase